MSVLRINALDDGLALAEGLCVLSTLSRHLCALPDRAPIVIMVHGYKYSPFDPQADPHAQVFALRPRAGCWKVRSWPRGLGFSGEGVSEGLCIGFGWHATAPGLVRGLPQVDARVDGAAARLAQLIAAIGDLAPGRPVDLIAHSLGGRVTLRALAGHDAPIRGRAILLGAADYRSGAEDALANPATRGMEFYNIVSAENALYDLFFRYLVPPERGSDRVLGRGLPGAPRRWIDLAIDDDVTLARLGALGLRISPRRRRSCHWSFYRRPGIFRLYRAILRERDGWSPETLRRLLEAGEGALPRCAWRPEPRSLSEIARRSVRLLSDERPALRRQTGT